MKTVLISNRKGGVGKTTTTINIASVLAKKGYKTLIVDLDTQSHIQFGLGVKKPLKGIHSALVKNENIENYLQKSVFKNLYFVPADMNMDTNLQIDENLLREKLKDLNFDYCLIDTPPTNDLMLKSAMIASDFVIVPMQTEYLGYVGAIQFLKLFYKMASNINTNFTFLGVVPTLYNKSIKEHNQIIKQLQKKLGNEKVLPPIRKDFKLSKSFIKGKPIIYFDEKSRGAKDYEKLSDEILVRIFRSFNKI